MNHYVQSPSDSGAKGRVISDKMLSVLALIVLGSSLLYFSGFSHMSALHNAAHDARHSAAFPCH